MPRCRHPAAPRAPRGPVVFDPPHPVGGCCRCLTAPPVAPPYSTSPSGGAAASHPPWPRGKHGLLLRMTVVTSNRMLPLGKGVCLLKELRSTWLPSARTNLEQQTVPWLPWPVSRLCVMAPVAGEPSLCHGPRGRRTVSYPRPWLGRLYVPSRSRGLGLHIRICWLTCYNRDYGPGLALTHWVSCTRGLPKSLLLLKAHNSDSLSDSASMSRSKFMRRLFANHSTWSGCIRGYGHSGASNQPAPTTVRRHCLVRAMGPLTLVA